MKLSARNVLEGKVVSIKEGPVSTEVTIELACGTQEIGRASCRERWEDRV